MFILDTNNWLWPRLKRLPPHRVVSWVLLTKFLEVRKLRMCLLIVFEGRRYWRKNIF